VIIIPCGVHLSSWIFTFEHGTRPLLGLTISLEGPHIQMTSLLDFCLNSCFCPIVFERKILGCSKVVLVDSCNNLASFKRLFLWFICGVGLVGFFWAFRYGVGGDLWLGDHIWGSILSPNFCETVENNAWKSHVEFNRWLHLLSLHFHHLYFSCWLQRPKENMRLWKHFWLRRYHVLPLLFSWNYGHRKNLKTTKIQKLSAK
jgi:hypothetical protein